MYAIIKPKTFDINQIAESGQAFRFKKLKENKYSVVSRGQYLEIEQSGDYLLMSHYPDTHYWRNYWQIYFDLDTDYDAIIRNAQQEYADDEFLQDAIRQSSGIRILRQDLFETVISYIISQRKNIPAISKCVETLCNEYGHQLGEYNPLHSFPTQNAMQMVSAEELKKCGLGYRAEYVEAACKEDFDIRMYSYEEWMNKLLKIKGIGPKVANCICLYGLHFLEAFPVDVWVDRIINEKYLGKRPKWANTGHSGVLQQYVFYYMRKICQ